MSAIIFAFLFTLTPATGGASLLGAAEKGPAAAVKGSEAVKVAVITVSGAITPVAAEYIEVEIAEAGSSGAYLLVIKLDTPGGLMSSMRQIVKSIMASPLPIAVYVSPSGGRAASAGVFITMAAHVAAMSPGTNIGAAHPVNIGGGGFFGKKKEGKKEGEGKEDKDSGESRDREAKPLSDKNIMAQKVVNDTVAFIKSIAERNGRNARWAERSVRESISSTEREALEEGVIDLVAEDLGELFEKMNGRKVVVSGKEITLDLSDAIVYERPMGLRYRILSVITDPNVAYMLMMLGIYGLFFEIANPGVILPGVLGGISLILAFFAFQVLPVNFAGILLIGLALILFVLEIKVVSYGMLSVGGIVSLFLGSIMLIRDVEPYYRISRILIFGVTGFTALFFIVGLGLAYKVQRKKPVTGMEGMLGYIGEAVTDISPKGRVRVHGELWTAVSDTPVLEGQRVTITGMEGMVLFVEPDSGGEE